MHHGSALSLQFKDVILLCADLQLPIALFIVSCLLRQQLHAAFIACQGNYSSRTAAAADISLGVKSAFRYHSEKGVSSALMEKPHVMTGPCLP